MQQQGRSLRPCMSLERQSQNIYYIMAKGLPDLAGRVTYRRHTSSLEEEPNFPR